MSSLTENIPRVLVVEDEPSIRDSIVYALESEPRFDNILSAKRISKGLSGSRGSDFGTTFVRWFQFSV